VDETHFGAPYWLVHRGDLHQALAKALEQRAPGTIHIGTRCLSFELSTDAVTLLLANGERVYGDALIGADGVHSCTRQASFGEGTATFTGFMAWRAVLPMARLPERLRQQNFERWLGPTGEVVTYPLRKGELLNFVAIVERDDWLVESWSEPGTVEECRGDFTDWHGDVLAIIEAIETPYKWALIGRPPLQHCSVGRVTLLGDACHPTLPVLGQGANMAIEDGVILARCLEASPDVTEALQRYEAARLPRTSRIVNSAFEGASRLRKRELADPDKAVAFMERQFGSAALAARYAWIYGYDAISAPI
jgi:2-polyprenyl-6-methoxyphenol hydroxylase-like FAD-dependent oxidoreductase